MADGRRGNRRLNNGLIAAGIVLLVAVGGYLGWSQLRGAQMRAELRQTPSAVVTSTPVAPSTEPAATLPPTAPVPEPTQPLLAASPSPAPATPEQPLVPTVTPLPATSTAVPAPVVPTAPHVPTATPALASVPVRLVIPDLKIDVPVVEMGWRVVQTASGARSDWVIPEDKAGHHINSAVLGEQGNLVISGHNNIFGQVFKPISYAWDNDKRTAVDSFTDRSDILNGRTVQLFDTAGQQFDYKISAFYRLKDYGVSAQQRIANGRFMGPTDQAQVTIITCWPPTTNTYRLVVIAEPVN